MHRFCASQAVAVAFAGHAVHTLLQTRWPAVQVSATQTEPLQVVVETLAVGHTTHEPEHCRVPASQTHRPVWKSQLAFAPQGAPARQSGAVPPPTFAVPPPTLAVPPPTLAAPPPFAVPPPPFAVPPPTLAAPPPFAVPPPTPAVPPPTPAVPPPFPRLMGAHVPKEHVSATEQVTHCAPPRPHCVPKPDSQVPAAEQHPVAQVIASHRGGG